MVRVNLPPPRPAFPSVEVMLALPRFSCIPGGGGGGPCIVCSSTVTKAALQPLTVLIQLCVWGLFPIHCIGGVILFQRLLCVLLDGCVVMYVTTTREWMLRLCCPAGREGSRPRTRTVVHLCRHTGLVNS